MRDMERPDSTSGNRPYLFLSYSHKDTDILAPLFQNIRANYRVLLDENIKAAREFNEEIARMIQDAALIVCFLSPRYVCSTYCLDEIHYARKKEKPILLIYLEDTILPDGLELRVSRLEAIDVRDNRCMEKLAANEEAASCRIARGDQAVPVSAPVVERDPKDIQRRVHLQPVLTNTAVPFVDQGMILHRERELQELERMLQARKIALALTGPGGVGKTSLTQALYSRLADAYDCIGWVGYHTCLKDSMLSSLDLCNEITDPDLRWNALVQLLKNDPARKLLILDNVDRDVTVQQDPEEDKLLEELSGWPNLNLLLTTRMKQLRGYTAYFVSYLGGEADPDPCTDLFYFYFDQEEYAKPPHLRQERDVVSELVKCAGYHTYAIELLARSAVYENTLQDYLNKIQQIGFQFPSLSVSSQYQSNSAPMADQLRALFRMNSRTDLEQQILWDFAVLPEGTALNQSEMEWLLGRTPNQVDKLCRDSWLRYKRGQGFSLHPLIREIVLFDLEEGRAPRGTAHCLVERVCQDTFFTQGESQSSVLRKLSMAESVARFSPFASLEEETLFYFKLGYDEFWWARRSLTSIQVLEGALPPAGRLPQTRDNQHLIGLIQYQLGYIKSSTKQYRDQARDNLQKALDIWTSLEDCEEETAMALDHLGYVLTDQEEDWPLSLQYLSEALEQRASFLEKADTLEHRRDYATTADNLGVLLSKSGYRREKAAGTDEAAALLEKAQEIREEVYRTTGQYADEAAWTAFNLGNHYAKNAETGAKAETCYRRALELYRELDQAQTGMFALDLMRTLTALAMYLAGRLAVNPRSIGEILRLTQEAQQLREGIQKEYISFFYADLEKNLDDLVCMFGSGES